MTRTILLLRHAHTEMAGRFCGQIDPPLSEQGRQQLPKLAEGLAKYPLTHIFSSDLLRCRETANFLAMKSGLTVELLPGLRELRFGEWEGLNWNEVSKKDAAYAERWMEQYPHLPAPGGEKFEGFRERVQSALAEVAGRIPGVCAAVVTHGGVIRTFMLEVLNLPESALASLECEYASSIEVGQRDARWYLRD
jgi:broad specificity phosphatase PhoE